MSNDPYGRISVMHFFNYVMRKVWLHQTRIGLSLYDVAGLGYLRESVRYLSLWIMIFLARDCRVSKWLIIHMHVICSFRALLPHYCLGELKDIYYQLIKISLSLSCARPAANG